MPDEKVDEPNTGTEVDETTSGNTPKAITEEEVNRRVEAARKQEKDKLYGKIEELSGVVAQLNAKAQAEQEAQERADAEAKAKAETKRQADLSAEDRLAEQMRKIEEQLAKESVERTRLERELREEREAQELEKYRQQILSGESEIIPELVRGSSKADIDRSVAFAKSRYQELFQASKSKAEGNRGNRVTDNMPGPTDPNPAALEEAELQTSLQNFQIDPERYMRDRKYKAEMDAKRSQVLDRLGSAYQRSARG